MRDDNFLQSRLDHLWDRYFPDIDQGNDVVIKFGRKARTRLGSIKQSQKKSRGHNPTIITINGLFKDKLVPEFIIDSVIAHEMVHYAHGFASPHDKKHDTPHAGGIIKKEMCERGLEDLFVLQKKWLKKNWKDFVEEKLPRKARIRRRRKRRTLFILKN